MISKGIRIHWDSSIEYIEIDLDDLDNVSAITSTIEWWKADKEWVKYNTRFKMERFNDGSVEIHLAYEQDNNKHLDPEEICFGHAIVRLSPGQAAGDASWIDCEGPADSGDSKWERVDNPLVGERPLHNPPEAQQTMFQ